MGLTFKQFIKESDREERVFIKTTPVRLFISARPTYMYEGDEVEVLRYEGQSAQFCTRTEDEYGDIQTAIFKMPTPEFYHATISKKEHDKRWLDSLKETFKPEWERECWVVAIQKSTGATEDEIKEIITKHGWDGKTTGASVEQTILTLWDILGYKPDISTKFNHMTPKQFSGKTDSTGVVFVKGHVMPLVSGVVSNFNGFGEDKIIAVVTK
jgi:hypothetical protein